MMSDYHQLMDVSNFRGRDNPLPSQGRQVGTFVLIYLQMFTILYYAQMMSAIKSGHVAYSRFARMAEMEEEHHERETLKKKITVERSGGGL